MEYKSNELIREVVIYLTNKIKKQIERALEENSVEELVERILKARKIHVYGMGRSGLVSKAFAMRLVHLGLDVIVLDETITYPLTRSDVFILVSGSGSTSSVVRLAKIAKKIGAHLVAITSNKDSELSRLADTLIYIPIEEDELKPKYAPMGTLFEDSVLIFFDALIAYIMDALGETEYSMKRRHSSLE
ncbi:MAG TPA: SIS domain-containing protein [Euryarchaeota archaeon]|nr:SIS domain-containing protein [Euryarchaeota archaeon]